MISLSPVISNLFAQFRHQYVDGSLTTELLMPHGEQFLVKATVTVGEQVIASALAADTSLETADDQAKIRALALLGFDQSGATQTLGSNASTPLPMAVNPGVIIPLTTVAAVSSPSSPPARPMALTSPVAAISVETAPMEIAPGEIEITLEPEGPPPEDTDEENIGRPIDSIAPDEAPAPSDVPASSLAAAAIESFDDTNPVDLSDIIAQTDVEMARLGWSSLQGRTYLEQTFHKRSRQQLTDEELLTFLLYLETQSTPSMG